MAAPDYAFDRAAFVAWNDAQYDGPDLRKKAMLKMLPLVIENQLTPTQRAYVVSYFFQKKTVEQIAVEFGVSKSTVSRTIHRGINRIHNVMRYFFQDFKVIYKKSGYLSNK